jgi:integrase
MLVAGERMRRDRAILALLAYGGLRRGEVMAADVGDYSHEAPSWLVNLPDHVVQVHRDPALDGDRPYGWGYTTTLILRGGDFVTPLAYSSASISVADLLP